MKELLQELHSLECSMSLKIPFLHSYCDFLPKNCGVVSDEQGEIFHQGTAAMERSYQRHWDESMLADYYVDSCKAFSGYDMQKAI